MPREIGGSVSHLNNPSKKEMPREFGELPGVP